MPNILITICARAGSKGLPNKNILPMHGKPLITWTIGQAKMAGLGFVVVSTNIKEIIDYSGQWYPVYERSDKNAEDGVPKLDAICEVLKWAEQTYNQKFDTIIDLDVMNPLRKPKDIEHIYQAFIKSDYDSLFSVTHARKNPYFNQVRKTRLNTATIACPDKPEFHCRQDAPEVYDVNSCIYLYKRDWLMDESHKSPISDNSGIYVMEDWQGFDIDNATDFQIVELMMEKHGLC